MLTAWGWTASATDVARVASAPGLPVRADPVLRALRAAPEPGAADIRVLGLDEWALRQGQTYATILVDPERHRIVDVLPDDRPETVARWLQAHPTVAVITRDRDEAFAKAIAPGAPTAVQGADRFHLLQNLRAVLERVFTRHRPRRGDGPAAGQEPVARPERTGRLSRQERRAQVQALTAQGYPQTAIAHRLGIDRKTVRQDAAAPPVGPPTRPRPPGPDSASAPPSPAQQRRQERWQQIRARAATGASISTIARELHRDRATVRHYATAERSPAPPPARRRPGRLSAWTDRLQALWATGEHHAQTLFRPLQAEGSTGRVTPVRRWVHQYRHGLQGGADPAAAPPAVAPRRLAWHCLQRLPAWTHPTARALLAVLDDPVVREAYTLAHLFRTLGTYRRSAALEPWLRRAEARSLPELQRFAAGIRRDQAAVLAALDTPWSQGPVDGFHHKIKRAKRVMYGRAKFDLLRQRLLHAAG
jgi:DNA-binding NarL/FixJ family response regulator